MKSIFQRLTLLCHHQTVYNAIKSGYRLLDGAGDYGNEKEAGEGVARAIKEGLVKREDLFITSKVRPVCQSISPISSIDTVAVALEHFPCQGACPCARQETARRLGPQLFRLVPYSLPHLTQ